jgi:uncharacterized protein YqeY
MTLRAAIMQAMKDAMKARDDRTLSAVRMIMAALKAKDIDARPSGRAEGISDEQILSMLQGMIKQRRESIALYTRGGRADLAEKEEAEIATIERFLPQQMTEAEAADAIRALIAEIGAAGIKDMGRIMAALKTRYAGRIDMACAGAWVKDALG